MNESSVRELVGAAFLTVRRRLTDASDTLLTNTVHGREHLPTDLAALVRSQTEMALWTAALRAVQQAPEGREAQALEDVKVATVAEDKPPRGDGAEGAMAWAVWEIECRVMTAWGSEIETILAKATDSYAAQ